MSKVKVRIYVAVGDDGSWSACGASPALIKSWAYPPETVVGDDLSAMSSNLRGYWVTAELDRPGVTEVAGEVER